MTNKEAVNWLINLTADIGKSEHHDLWHYEQALYEIKEMLDEDTNVPSRKGVFIPDITVEMFRNASLEGIEDLMVSGEMKDISLPSAQPEKRTQERTETHACDLISRQEIYAILDKCGLFPTVDEIREAVENLTGLPKTKNGRLRTGKWVKNEARGRGHICNCCGNYLDFAGVNGYPHYCPNCGRRMEG